MRPSGFPKFWSSHADSLAPVDCYWVCAGAEAHTFCALTARLKSCPDTKQERPAVSAYTCGIGVRRTKQEERLDQSERIHCARVLAVFSAWSCMS